MLELNTIDGLIAQLEQLQPIDPKRKETLEKKFRLEFNYNTNHIEGNTITYSETELLLIFDNPEGNHTLRELEEMKGSDIAFQLTKDLAADSERPLTEQNIKYLNQILLVRPFWKDAITEDGQPTRRQIKVGEYKEYPNSVRLQNGEIFHYASPAETPILMGELIKWFREEEEKKEMHIVEIAAMLHYKFVRVHPFDDGNGRLSRLLMNYVLFKNNLPPIIIKTEDKKNYLLALNKADAGDERSFIKYIAQQLIWSLEISIKAAKGESIDEPGDLAKKIKVLKQKLQIGTEKVTVTKSRQSLLDTFNNSLFPLFKELSSTFQEIDSMFKSSTELLLFGSTGLGSNLDSSIAGVRTGLQTKIYSEIEYRHEFKNFRTTELNKNFRVSLDVVFHNHVYEIIVDSKPYISKLYSEVISEEEIKGLCEKLGLKVVSEIENAITE